MAENAFQVYDDFRDRGADGFRVTFANGFSISVVWGHGRYGDGTRTAETAIFAPDGGFVTIEGDIDEVQGWQTPESVAFLMASVAQLSPGMRQIAAPPSAS